MASIDYVRVDTFVHRLHPLVKIILLLSSLIVAFITTDIALLLVWLTMLITWWIIARINPKRMTLIFKLLIGTFLFLIIIQGFMYRYGVTPLFKIGSLKLWGGKDIGVFTLEGAIWGVMISLRVLVAVLTIPIFTMTTPMTQIAATLAKLKVPYTFVLMFVTRIRFVPLTHESWSNIMLAQQLRALDIKKMNFLKRATKVYTKSLPTLVLFLLKKATTLQVAIESRAFGAPIERTFILEKKLTVRDYAVITLIIGLVAAFIAIKVLYGDIIRIQTKPF